MTVARAFAWILIIAVLAAGLYWAASIITQALPL